MERFTFRRIDTFENQVFVNYTSYNFLVMFDFQLVILAPASNTGDNHLIPRQG